MARPTDTEIDDRIDNWHSGRFADGIGLPTALGWSQDEYDRFVMDSSAIPDRPLPTPDEIAATAYEAMPSARSRTLG